MAAASKIHEFPSEMITALAAQAEKADLLSCRAVCRKWKEASDDTFLKTFFTTRTHLFWASSLETLKSISLTPRFAKRIKQINIVTQIALLRLPPRACQYEQPEGLDKPLRDGTSTFNDVTEIYALLKSIFSNIAKYDSSISLVISNKASGTVYGWRDYLLKLSLDNKREGLHYIPYMARPETYGGIAEVLLSAAANSQIALKCLDFGWDDHGIGIFGVDLSNRRLHSKSYLVEAFSHLTVLKLKANIEAADVEERWRFADMHGEVISIREVFRAALHLRELCLAGNHHGTYQGLLHLFDLYYLNSLSNLPKLKKLELHRMNLSRNLDMDFLDFVRAFAPSLQHLKLSKLVLVEVEGDGWAGVVDELALFPVLEKVDLSDLLDGSIGAKRIEVVKDEVTVASVDAASECVRESFVTALHAFGHQLRAPAADANAPGVNGDHRDNNSNNDTLAMADTNEGELGERSSSAK